MVAPTNLKVSPTVEGLNLTWGVSGTEGLGGWLVHWRPKTAPVIPWQTAMLPAAARTYTVTSLQVESYEIQIRALSARGIMSGAGTPEAKPAPPPAPKLVVGLNAGNWGANALPDIAGTGVRAVRLAEGLLYEASAYKAAGFKVCGIFGESGTIGNIDAAKYAAGVASVAKQYALDAVEVLNEPGGSWFWRDPDAFGAYVALCKATHEAVNGLLPTVVLASWDGGQGGQVKFGEECKKLGILDYCDGVTVHPYGGSGGQYGGFALDRRKCELAIEQSGKPLHITEAGLPTGTGSTGDSQAWSFQQQAEGLGSFVAFCAANPKIASCYWYGYKNSSDSGPAQYGVEMHDSWTHKPAFKVLGEHAKMTFTNPPMIEPTYPGLTSLVEVLPHGWGWGEKPTPYEAAAGVPGVDFPPEV